MILQRDPHGFRDDAKKFIAKIKELGVDTCTENNLTASFKHVLFLEFIHNSHPALSYKRFVKCIIYDVLN
ncbi:hypothetical protein NLN78_14235, partial [Citrobacter portucalensis]|nr:hypothetical protein [Citrobacter portucalensis]